MMKNVWCMLQMIIDKNAIEEKRLEGAQARTNEIEREREIAQEQEWAGEENMRRKRNKNN